MEIFSGTWTRRSKWLCGGRAGGENRCLLRSTSRILTSQLLRSTSTSTSKLTKFWRRKNLPCTRRGDRRSLLKLVKINNCAISLLSAAVEEKADMPSEMVRFFSAHCLFNKMSDKLNRSCLPKLLLNFQQNKNGANACWNWLLEVNISNVSLTCSSPSWRWWSGWWWWWWWGNCILEVDRFLCF